MNEIEKLKKQKEKLKKQLEEKEVKEQLEKEVKDLEKELKGNKKRNDNLNSAFANIGKGFDAFQRFADKYGSDGSELDEFIEGKKKKKK